MIILGRSYPNICRTKQDMKKTAKEYYLLFCGKQIMGQESWAFQTLQIAHKARRAMNCVN
jgi:hypothetical protein